MCGRYILSSFDISTITDRFLVSKNNLAEYKPSFNIAPTQNSIVITNDNGVNTACSFRWGLIPHWAKDISIGVKMINARAETIDEKPSFKRAFASRRCLVPANGFYEWRKEGNKKIPYRIFLKDAELFAFAGICESWQDSNATLVQTYSIITTEATS